MRTLKQSSLLAAATLLAGSAFGALTDAHPATGFATTSTWNRGVSRDGLTNVGYSASGGLFQAYMMVGGVLTSLDNLPVGAESWALAASNSSSLVVGYALDSSGFEQAVTWSGTTPTLVDINADFLQSRATGVSADGNTIVGWGYNATYNNNQGRDEFFFRQGANLFNFSQIFGTNSSRATGVSADGTIVVGTIADDFANPGPSSMLGFVYVIGSSDTLVDAVGGIQAFTNTNLDSTYLTAISGDGSVAVGYVSIGNGQGSQRAIKYTLANGGSYAALGMLNGGTWSTPNAVNANGSVIVGVAENSAGGPEAFVYQNGSIAGLGFLTGGTYSNATGVSADGSVIVGYSNVTGGYTHAFVYANQTMLDADEWMRSLNGPGSLVAMTTNLNLLTLEGAHHRPLMSYDSMGKQSQVWATGDFGTSSRQVDQNKTSGEIGVSGTFGDLVLGGAAGHATLNQDLIFGGSAHIKGDFILAEADYRLADKESIVSLVLLHGIWDADASRGYETGGGTDLSTGSTDMKTSSVRVRIDGPAQKFLGPVSASPFASFTLTRTSADAYRETGGSFPASFDAQTHTAKESRLGLTTKFVVTPSTTLLLTAEWIHRFDDAGDGLTGTSLTTSSAFAAAGVAPTKDQGRFGLDVDHKLSADTLLSLSLHAAGNGPSADLAAALSIRRAF